ncbi:class I SAM-dependent methyltransferase [Paenibacillus cymbidii]|uniref:class I SAM-dependent methyltransferase n=1 Tax=Paenibacillus cymbidii TaxID=1639034 RepID=UPI001082202B|nr:class I SAM-dependent methyltransferase [Paenibacillus cymbidii]
MPSPSSKPKPPLHRCRFCREPLTDTFVDLGLSPLANRFVRPEEADRPALFYPLHASVCRSCLLVQVGEYETPAAIFADYPYFSSYSDSWLAHAEQFAASAVKRFALGPRSQVVEVASNDGYLLQYFRERGVPALGIEPAGNVAQAARDKGIPVIAAFFGTELARRLASDGLRADLLVANNVLAHVPDLNDFVAGIALLLKDDGTASLEFPHLLELMRHGQFDTIYHEHFSYFSLHAVRRIFAAHGLAVVDAEPLPTHGGSLRVYARRSDAAPGERRAGAGVANLLRLEREAGLLRLDAYTGFAERATRAKTAIWRFLLEQRAAGRTVAGYGAPAKGNTLLNYCGVDRSLLSYVVDRNPHKQGQLLPGTLIPVYAPERLRETKPDTVVVMPWNLKREIADSLGFVKAWGGRLAVLLPEVEWL